MTQVESVKKSPMAAVPLFELATQWQVIRNEVEGAVREVLESQQYTSGAVSGPFVGRFEENLGKMVGGHVVALSSGTDAILAALMALGIGRDEGEFTKERYAAAKRFDESRNLYKFYCMAFSRGVYFFAGFVGSCLHK